MASPPGVSTSPSASIGGAPIDTGEGGLADPLRETRVAHQGTHGTLRAFVRLKVSGMQNGWALRYQHW